MASVEAGQIYIDEEYEQTYDVEAIQWSREEDEEVVVVWFSGVNQRSVFTMSRFAKWIDDRGAEGLHHICYEVDDIDAALAHAEAQGATLRICQACQVHGSHPHPEGWVAFLDDESGGIEIEFMQVYTPEQLKEYEDFKGI